MSRFITTFDTCCIDLDKIVCMKFTPGYDTVLSIYTTVPELKLNYKNTAMDRRAIRDIIRDIRHLITNSHEQPEYFWRMLDTIERWLNEEDKNV